MTLDNISLAAERLERAALAELHAAADGPTRESLGLQQQIIGTVLVSSARHEPSILLNRAIGLGVASAATPETVDAVLGCYATADVARFFFQLHPDARPPGMDRWLAAAGLEKTRGWMKFHRGPLAPPPVASSLRVRPVTADEAGDFARIVAAGFDLGEAAIPLLAALAERPGWRLYLSFAGDTPAGAAALFIHDGLAWLDWAATVPAFRGRGSQTALLCRRIQDAVELGCRRLFTITGEEVPGDPQRSYRNIEKVGFQPAHLRENYAPPKPAVGS